MCCMCHITHFHHPSPQALLKHDKPMHRKAGHVPHLRHLPAYLRDLTGSNPNEVAAAGAAAVAAAQRRPKQKGPKAKKHKAQAAAGAAGPQDPLKAAAGGGAAGGRGGGSGSSGPAAAAALPSSVSGGVFMKAAKKGGSAADEQLTELEKRAFANPLKPSKARVLQGVGGAAFQAKVLGPKVAALAQGAHNKHNVRAVRPKMGAGAKRRR